jgi:hypothetical protein
MTATYIYIRAGTASDADLLLVETSLFTHAENLPDGCWFKRHFAGLGKTTGTGYVAAPPSPTGEKDGIAIYALPIPANVFREMLHGMRFMDLLPDMYRHVPPSLRNDMTLSTWRHYLDYYGLAMEEEGEDEPGTKRLKTEADLKTERDKIFDASIKMQYYVRVIRALVARIKAENPQWPAFQARAVPELKMHFVNTYARHSQDGSFTFMLPLPGDPALPDANIAHELGLGFSCDMPGRKSDAKEYLTKSFIKELGLVNSDVYWHLIRNRKSHAKKPDYITTWPTATQRDERIELTPGDHDILEMTVHYTQ